MTQVFIAERGGGKSTAAINWVAERPESRTCIVANVAQERLMLAQARSMHPSIDWGELNFVSVHAVRRLRGALREYAVDEAQDVMTEDLQLPIAFSTWTVSS